MLWYSAHVQNFFCKRFFSLSAVRTWNYVLYRRVISIRLFNSDVRSIVYWQWKSPTSTRVRCSVEFLCVRWLATSQHSALHSLQSVLSSVHGYWTFTLVNTWTSASTAVSVRLSVRSARCVSSHLSYAMTTRPLCYPDAHPSGSVNLKFSSIKNHCQNADTHVEMFKCLYKIHNYKTISVKLFSYNDICLLY